MKQTNKIDVRETPAVISDSGKIKIGDYTPLFPPPVRRQPANTSDGGKVKIGDYTPLFPAQRGK
jgi:hypothetical protein